MALLKFKRSAVPAKIPSIADLDLGELAINTYDGKVYTKKDDGTQAIVEVGGGGGVQTIASADGSVTVTGTTDIDLSVAVAAATTTIILPVRNNTGATLAKGTAVYINGALGQNPTVTKAIATGDATSAQTLGLMTANLSNNSVGNVTLIGTLTNLDTSAFSDGQQLYLSPTTAGALTATKPYAPNHLVYMAVVEHAHPSLGKLFVKVQNGYEMDELHDVSAQNPANNDGLFYNTTSGLWEKKSIVTALGYTPVNRAGDTMTGQLSITGAGNVNGGNLQLGDKAEGTNKWSVMTGAHYNGVSQAKGVMLIGSYSNSTANQVSIGGNVYEANPATQIVFFTSPTATHATGGLSRLSIDGNGAVTASVDIRSPIYYDSNNTAYYIDPNSTSQVSGANFNFGATGRVYDDGNFHIDGLNSPVWINSIGNSTIELNTQTSGYVNIGNSARAPIYYDSANTAYYVDPHSTSVLLNLNLNGGLTTNGSITVGNGAASSDIYMADSDEGTRRIHCNSNRIGFLTQAEGWGSFCSDNGDWTTEATGYAASSFRAPIFYDSNNTGYYVDPNSTSNLNKLTASNRSMVGNASIFMSDLDANTWYPVTIPVPVARQTTLRIENGLNSNVPSWSTHPAGFSCYFEWTSNGSGWGTIPVSRRITDWREAFTSVQIVGGIDQMTFSSQEVIWLRGGANYFFSADCDVTPTVRTTSYDAYGQVVAPRSTVFNDPWTMVAGKMSYGTFQASDLVTAANSVRAPVFYDSNDTAYYLDPHNGSNLYTTKFNTATNGAAGRTIAIKDASTSEILFGAYAGNWTSALQIQNNDNSDFVWISPLDASNNALFRTGGCGLDFYTDGGNDTGTYSLFVGSGYATGQSSLRAPIFYDSNNTGYYVDPASTSNVSAMVSYSYQGNGNVGGTGSASWHPSGIYSAGYNWLYGGISAGGGDITSVNAVYANAYYDSGNTGYYVDPASTSVLNNLSVGGSTVFRSDWTTRFQSGSDFTSGTLVTTDIPATGFAGESFIIEITGKSYSATNLPFKVVAQGYLYNDTIINYTGISYGGDFATYIKVFEEGGVLKFWWPRISYWNSFNVNVMAMDGPTNNTITRNRVTAIANSTEPTGTKKQQINLSRFMRGDVSATNSVDVRAPVFYDSDNTTYYLDPATGFNFQSSGVTFSSTGSGLFVANAEGTGSTVRLGAAWSRAGSYANGSYTLGSESSIHFWISNSEKGYIDSSSNLFMNGSVQAPIFYDSANTGFYVDPNSTSRLERLVLSARYDNYFVGSMAVVNAVNNFQTLTDTFGQMNVMQVSDTSGFTNAPTGLYPYGGVMSWRTENHSYQMYASHTGDLAYKTQWNNDNYSGWQTPVVYGRIGNSASGRAIYGGVYYDTDNTGYFLNPTGTSTLANLDVASGIDSPWYYEAAIEIRERSFGGVLTTSLNNAPRLGFHWGGRVAMQLVLDSGGTFNVMNGDCGAYSSLASGNFTANGSITATGNVTAYSDIRIKANVETIPSALDKLDQIRGVTYTRTDLDDKEQRYAGVIAQEIEAVLPEAVRDLGNIKAVDYNATIALLIQAVKELRDEVEALRK